MSAFKAFNRKTLALLIAAISAHRLKREALGVVPGCASRYCRRRAILYFMHAAHAAPRRLLTPEHAVPAGKILPCVCAAVGDVHLRANDRTGSGT